MSQRPRFGDGGQLRRPIALEGPAPGIAWSEGDIWGEFAPDRDWDPFERTSSGLLLAEDFARADLADSELAAAWYLEHGVLDLQRIFPLDPWEKRDLPSESRRFHDSRAEVLQQQHDVRWLLLTLARLSQGSEAWDPRWMAVVIGSGGKPGVRLDIEDGELHFHLERFDPEEVPAGEGTVWVPEGRWNEHWSFLIDIPNPDRLRDLLRLSVSREGLMEVVRTLLEPHVRIASQSEVDLLWPETEYPLVVSERRRWHSVLSPIYLQLLEGLRRVTEGQLGASYCRECGEPYLTLDARRSSFCTDRHRLRFFQRERRRRVDRERAAQQAAARLKATPMDAMDRLPEEPEA